MGGSFLAAVLVCFALMFVEVVPSYGENIRNVEYLAELIKNLWRCQHATAPASSFDANVVSCPAFFDGWLCWPSVPVDTEITHLCPPHLEDPPVVEDISLPMISSSASLNYDDNRLGDEEEEDGDDDEDDGSMITRRCTDGGIWRVVDNQTSDKNLSTCSSLNVKLLGQEEEDNVRTMIESLPTTTSDELASEEAFDDCIRNVLTQPFLPKEISHCKRTFDGWGCWNDTMAGDVAVIPCPSFIPGFVSTRKAHKVCNPDGTWFRHPFTNKTWSNYTTCVDQEDLMFRQYINSIYIAGYSLSAIALFISLVIFYYFKTLKCTRITIHKNLFISFIINNLMWIIWYTEVIENPSVILHNKITCQILHVMVHYFMVSNYFWMFCEGLYLHTVLVVAFVSEDIIVKIFYFVGWGIPFILISLYAVLRGSSSTHTEFCWIQESVYQWILSGPVCLSLLLNLLFLINIVRVLVTKLRAVNSPDANQTKKAARATLILIPLLGLHYLLTPFRPEPRSSGEAIYETASALVTSLQGLCVAFLFCFINGEVTATLRRKWNLARLMRTAGRRSNCGAVTSISFLGRSPSEGNGRFCQETQVYSEV